MVLLTEVAGRFDNHNTKVHDEVIRDNTAAAYASRFHRLVQSEIQETDSILCSSPDSTTSRLREEGILEIAVLSNALQKIFIRSSDDAIRRHGIHSIREHLVPSLAKALIGLAKGAKRDATRLMAMVDIVKIMTRVDFFLDSPLPEFLEATILLLKQSLPRHIKIKNASAIVQFLRNDAWSGAMEPVGNPVSTDDGRRLVAFLSEVARDTGDLLPLQNLVQVSFLRPLVTDHPCFVDLLCHYLQHENRSLRKAAINLVITSLKGPKKHATVQIAFRITHTVLVNALIQATLTETYSKLLRTLLKLLHKMLSYLPQLSSSQASSIRKVFFVAQSNPIAARLYIQTSRKALLDPHVVSNMVDLTVHSDKSIGREAWAFLQDVAFWNPMVEVLFGETTLLRHMTRVFQPVSCLETTRRVLQIGRHCIVGRYNHHEYFLQDPEFCHALVSFVTDQKQTTEDSLTTLTIALDLLASCTRQEQRTDLLVPAFDKLLPWIQQQTNQTNNSALTTILGDAVNDITRVLTHDATDEKGSSTRS